MQDLKGKTAVVTGAASGLGLGLAVALAREGMNIVAADVEEAPGEAVVARIRDEGFQAIFVRTDVADLQSVKALAKAAEREFGGAQLLCNNAGVFMVREARYATHQDWRWILGVNLWGPVHGVEVFLPGMLAQKTECHICSTSSMAGTLPSHNSALYATSKYGVVGLSETLALELAGTNVSVSVVLPAGMQTRIQEAERNRPAALASAPAGPVPQRAPRMAVSVSGFSPSLAPLEAASVVVNGIRKGQLHIFTDVGTRALIEARHRRMVGEFDRLAEWLESRPAVSGAVAGRTQAKR